MDKFAALKKAQEKEGGEFRSEYWGNKMPRCPHCGTECGVIENEWFDLCEEGEHEVSCPHCEGDFSVSVTVIYRYSTDKQ